MADLSARGPVKAAGIEVTITRADGTVERLGTVAYWHRNPLRRLAWRLGRLLRTRKG